MTPQFRQKLLDRLQGDGAPRQKGVSAKSPLDDPEILEQAAREYVDGAGLLYLQGKYATHHITLRNRFRAMVGLPKGTKADLDANRALRRAQKLKVSAVKAKREAKAISERSAKIAKFISPKGRMGRPLKAKGPEASIPSVWPPSKGK
jgi:hypothetical protein